MQTWEKTEAYYDYLTFFGALNESVRSLPNSSKFPYSENAKALVEFLDTLDKLIEEYPPIDQPQRFGNQAFRSWHKRLTQVTIKTIKKKN